MLEPSETLQNMNAQLLTYFNWPSFCWAPLVFMTSVFTRALVGLKSSALLYYGCYNQMQMHFST